MLRPHLVVVFMLACVEPAPKVEPEADASVPDAQSVDGPREVEPDLSTAGDAAPNDAAPNDSAVSDERPDVEPEAAECQSPADCPAIFPTMDCVAAQQGARCIIDPEGTALVFTQFEATVGDIGFLNDAVTNALRGAVVGESRRLVARIGPPTTVLLPVDPSIVSRGHRLDLLYADGQPLTLLGDHPSYQLELHPAPTPPDLIGYQSPLASVVLWRPIAEPVNECAFEPIALSRGVLSLLLQRGPGTPVGRMEVHGAISPRHAASVHILVDGELQDLRSLLEELGVAYNTSCGPPLDEFLDCWAIVLEMEVQAVPLVGDLPDGPTAPPGCDPEAPDEKK